MANPRWVVPPSFLLRQVTFSPCMASPHAPAAPPTDDPPPPCCTAQLPHCTASPLRRPPPSFLHLCHLLFFSCVATPLAAPPTTKTLASPLRGAAAPQFSCVLFFDIFLCTPHLPRDLPWRLAALHTASPLVYRVYHDTVPASACTYVQRESHISSSQISSGQAEEGEEEGKAAQGGKQQERCARRMSRARAQHASSDIYTHVVNRCGGASLHTSAPRAPLLASVTPQQAQQAPPAGCARRRASAARRQTLPASAARGPGSL